MGGPYLRMKELAEYLQLSPSTIYDLVNPDSERFDKTFPARIQFGQRAVGWSKPEIDEWCNRPKQKVRLDRIPGAELPVNPIRIRKPSTIKPKGIPPPELIEWERMIRLQQRDGYLLELLGQEAWTPAMAALLANGYKAPLGCTKIPKPLKKLDGELDTPNGNFRTSVKSIVRNWEEYIEDVEENSEASSHVEPLLMTRSPIEFLIWFDEEEIDTPWLRLIRRLAGCPVQDDPQSFKLLTFNVPTVQVIPCPATNDSALEETSVSLAKPRIHRIKTRRNLLDSAIDKAIALAGNDSTPDVFMRLRALALDEEPPFTGGLDKADLLYTNAKNESSRLSLSMLDGRLQRRRKKID